MATQGKTSLSSTNNSIDGLEDYVLLNIISTISIIIKRGWKDGEVEWKQQVMEELYSLVVPSSTQNEFQKRRILGLRIMKSLINEFSASSASDLRVPYEFHIECQLQFEHGGYLLKFFSAALEFAKEAVQDLQIDDSGRLDLEQSGPSSPSSSTVSILRYCVDIIAEILRWNWPQHPSNSSSSGSEFLTTLPSNPSSSPSAQRKDLEGLNSSGSPSYHRNDVDNSDGDSSIPTPIYPGQEWREILIENPTLLTLLFTLLQNGIGTPDQQVQVDIRQNLATTAANCLGQLASCHPAGPIFLVGPGQQQMQIVSAYLRPFLQYLVAIMNTYVHLHQSRLPILLQTAHEMICFFHVIFRTSYCPSPSNSLMFSS
jgi:hypothetical protein